MTYRQRLKYLKRYNDERSCFMTKGSGRNKSLRTKKKLKKIKLQKKQHLCFLSAQGVKTKKLKKIVNTKNLKLALDDISNTKKGKELLKKYKNDENILKKKIKKDIKLPTKKGIYVFTTWEWVQSAFKTGKVLVAVGEAGLKKEGEGDLIRRLNNYYNSKFRAKDLIIIHLYENPIGVSRDFDVQPQLDLIATRDTELVNGKLKKIERWYFKLPNNLKKQIRTLDKEDDKGKQPFVDYFKSKLDKVLSKFDDTNITNDVEFRAIQVTIIDRIKKILKDKGLPINLVAELAPRLGKTILFLGLFEQLKDFKMMVLMAYGAGLSVLSGYPGTIEKYRNFKHNMVVIDAEGDNAEEDFYNAIKKGKKVVVLTSLHLDLKKYKWISEYTGKKLAVLEECDFGGHTEKQIPKVEYLIKGDNTLRINASGTNIEKLGKAMGGDSITDTIIVPYSMIEHSTDIKDVVIRKMYNLEYDTSINQFIEKLDDKHRPTLTALGKKPLAQQRFWEEVAQALFGTGTQYGMTLSEKAGEVIKNIMVFTSFGKKSNKQLAKIWDNLLDEYKVIVLSGDITDMKEAQHLVKVELGKIDRGEYGSKTRLIVITEVIGSRSFSVGEIQACLFLKDGGDLGAWIQQSSRCLDPYPGKKYGHIFDFGFDQNKTRNTECSYLFDAMTLKKLDNNKDKNISHYIKRVLDKASLYGKINGVWGEIGYEELLKRTESTRKLMDMIVSIDRFDSGSLTNEQIKIYLQIINSSDKKIANKIKKILKTGKTYEIISGKKNPTKKNNELFDQIRKARAAIIHSATSLYYLVDGRCSTFKECLKYISKNKELNNEFCELFGVPANLILKLDLPYDSLDILVANCINGNDGGNHLISKVHSILGKGDPYKTWKEIVQNIINEVGFEQAKQFTWLIGCGGYGTEVDVLVDTFGKEIIKNITFNDKFRIFTNAIKRKYNNINIHLGNFMSIANKFNAVIINPSYKQGLWRTFMKQGLHIGKDIVAVISPDATTRVSTKYDENKKMLENGKIQLVVPCQEDFEEEGFNISPSSEICYHIFNKNKAFNTNIFNKPLSKEEKISANILNKIETIGLKTGFLSHSRKGLGDKKATPSTKTIDSIVKSGPIIIDAKSVKGSNIKVIDNPSILFFVNRFFGMNRDDTVYHTEEKSIGISIERVYAIGNISKFTVDEFKRIYFSKLMRFVLKHFRGKHNFCLGWSIRKLPVISPSINDLYKYVGLTEEEIEYVETNIN